MDGMHDVGGMAGFGSIPIEDNEPVFHGDWEGKSFAMVLLSFSWRKWNLDQTRSSHEQLTPQQYLSLSYYERLITGLADRAIKAGLVTTDEIRAGHASAVPEQFAMPLTRKAVPAFIKAPRNYLRPNTIAPAYRVGDRICTVTDSPDSHTRLPRYARGRSGTIILYHGCNVFADANADGTENPQHLYAVRFSGSELWGQQGNPRDSVTLDLYEPYLRHA